MSECHLSHYNKWKHVLCFFHLWRRLLGYETVKSFPVKMEDGDCLFGCFKCGWSGKMEAVKPYLEAEDD
jgi:hypothetical protein